MVNVLCIVAIHNSVVSVVYDETIFLVVLNISLIIAVNILA